MWNRYVDDCLAIVKTSEIDGLLCYLNEIDTSIEFSVEKEVERKLPFLDTDNTKKK